MREIAVNVTALDAAVDRLDQQVKPMVDSRDLVVNHGDAVVGATPDLTPWSSATFPLQTVTAVAQRAIALQEQAQEITRVLVAFRWAIVQADVLIGPDGVAVVEHPEMVERLVQARLDDPDATAEEVIAEIVDELTERTEELIGRSPGEPGDAELLADWEALGAELEAWTAMDPRVADLYVESLGGGKLSEAFAAIAQVAEQFEPGGGEELALARFEGLAGVATVLADTIAVTTREGGLSDETLGELADDMNYRYIALVLDVADWPLDANGQPVRPEAFMLPALKSYFDQAKDKGTPPTTNALLWNQMGIYTWSTPVAETLGTHPVLLESIVNQGPGGRDDFADFILRLDDADLAKILGGLAAHADTLNPEQARTLLNNFELALIRAAEIAEAEQRPFKFAVLLLGLAAIPLGFVKGTIATVVGAVGGGVTLKEFVQFFRVNEPSPEARYELFTGVAEAIIDSPETIESLGLSPGDVADLRAQLEAARAGGVDSKEVEDLQEQLDEILGIEEE